MDRTTKLRRLAGTGAVVVAAAGMIAYSRGLRLSLMVGDLVLGIALALGFSLATRARKRREAAALAPRPVLN